MTLYEGDKVEVVKILQDMDMAQIKYNNEVGLFPLSVLKTIKRNTLNSNSSPESACKIRNNNNSGVKATHL